LPIDVAVYHADTFQSDNIVCVDESNPYFSMIRGSWGQRLREVFVAIEDPSWDGGAAQYPLKVSSGRYQVLKKITNPKEKLV
jgi:putative proteasome-type protease